MNCSAVVSSHVEVAKVCKVFLSKKTRSVLGSKYLV